MANDVMPALPRGAASLLRKAIPEFKDDPIEFIGRSGVLEQYEYAVMTAVQPVAGHTGATGFTVTAAPGAGKTSVVSELAKRLRKKGVAVGMVHASVLRSPARLADALKRQPPWSDQEWLEKMGTKAVQGLTAVTDAAIQAGLNYGATQVGLPPDLPDLGITKNVAAAWLSNPEPTILETLRMLDVTSANGAVLIIDEAQLMHDISDRSDLGYNCVTETINSLATPNQRRGLGIARTSIILSGLSDTRRKVKDVGPWGLHRYILPPLPMKHVRTMIRRGIQRGAEGDGNLSAQAERLWIEPLANQFGDWTRHAQAAAQAAQEVIRKCKDEALTGNGLYATAMLADRFRDDAYRNIIDTAQDDGVTRQMITLAGYALLRNGNRIPEDNFMKLIGQGVKAGWQHKDDRKDAKIATLNRLLRAGIVDRTDEIEEITEPGFIYGPIPTMNHAITRNAGEPTEKQLRIIRKAGLETEAPDPSGEPFRPDWAKLEDADRANRQRAADRPWLKDFATTEETSDDTDE